MKSAGYTLPVEHLRAVFPLEMIACLRTAAEAGFQDKAGSQSVTLAEFECRACDVLGPVKAAGLDASACRLEHSWLRKKVPPNTKPHSWHQDGGLGVRFPLEPGPPIPMTPLLTLWVPLDACGVDAPGLEFVRRRLDGLLHFTELTDADLRQRFAPEEFWAPVLEPGDGLVFLNGTLHRTWYRPEMRRARISVEYRLFQDSATP